MQSIQHEQPRYADPTFPLELHFDGLNATRRSIYTNWHNGIELLYCVEGSARLLLDSEHFAFESGDIVVIGSNVLHTISAQGETCSYHCLIVEPDFLQAHGFDMEHAHFVQVIRDPQLCALFENIVLEDARKEASYKPAVVSAVLALFVVMTRGHLRQRDTQKHGLERTYPLAIMQALHYIRIHLCEPISIDDISTYVSQSKYYFCRNFHAYTGYAVLHYINMLRCDYAHRLITENGLNVSEAAHQLGVHNLSYFSRLYKRHMGVLPSSIRPMKAKKAPLP